MILALIISICFVLIGSTIPVFAQPSVDASSAILIDGNTGRVLWSKSPYVKRPIASTTKIMTGLLAIKKASPEEVVVSDKSVEKISESEIFLKNKEKMTVQDLIYALMLQSANDAAVALANHISGSVNKFADLMNQTAAEMGLKDTSYRNPHGLGDVNISTSYDLAQLARIALKNQTFKNVVATKSATISGNKKRKIFNRNKLLFQYPYVIGVKTGFTHAAGYCLVSAAKKGKMLLIATTLNSKTSNSSFTNAKKIYEYGFSEYRYQKISNKGEIIAKVGIPFHLKKMKLASNEDFGVVIKKNSSITSKIDLSNKIKLPIKKGDALGRIKVLNEGKIIAIKDLKAQESVDDVGFFGRIIFRIKSLFRSLSPLS